MIPLTQKPGTELLSNKRLLLVAVPVSLLLWAGIVFGLFRGTLALAAYAGWSVASLAIFIGMAAVFTVGRIGLILLKYK